MAYYIYIFLNKPDPHTGLNSPLFQGELNPPFDGKLNDFELTVKNPGVRSTDWVDIDAHRIHVLAYLPTFG